jgi:hypothetical protein
VFWYVKGHHTLRDFQKVKDTGLVELMHTKGIELAVGSFESIATRASDYLLTRLGRHEFTITILKSK